MAGPAPPRRAEKIRDAARSRAAILGAAEALFAERGFTGVSLGEIAATAGLSRGTPSYFFGSKAELYRATLEQVFADREEATRRACRPLVEWAEAGAHDPIEGPLRTAVEGYLDFLLGRPTFIKLIQREELAGAARMSDVPRESQAIEEAFEAVRAARKRHGLKVFETGDAVFLFVALTFFPLAQSATFMAALNRDPHARPERGRHIRFAVEQLLHLIEP